MWIRIWLELKKPFNLISTVLTVLGLLSGFYFYYKSEKTPGISYSKSFLRVFDSQSSSSLSLLDANNKKIEEDVYALNILVWNSGSIDLGPDKVRRPMVFSIESGLIVEAAIIAQSNRESHFRVSDIKPKSVELKWLYFDPQDGFRLRIVCTQCTEKGLRADIRMLGLEGMEERDESDFSPRTNASVDKIAVVTLFGLMGLLVFIGSRIGLKEKASNDAKGTLPQPPALIKTVSFIAGLFGIVVATAVFAGVLYVSLKLVPDLVFPIVSGPRPNI